MPVGRAWYVHGQKLAFPYGERWVSGPFDDSAAAHAEARRLRPLYPDANLSARLRQGKSLPECRPDRNAPAPALQFNLARVAERRAAAEAIAERVRALGLVAIVEDWDGEPDVDCVTPNLSCNIWLAHLPAAPMPIISWYGAKQPLQAVRGAWGRDDVNWSHRAKATSCPRDWAELFDMLETGLLAAVDGSAFELER